jgi:predicted MFS family arabinose efflux permease
MATAAGVAVANITVAQSLLGDIAHTLGVGAGAAGVVISATQLGYACGLVLVVPLGDVIQPRRLVALQSSLSASALAVAAAAPTFAVLLGAMALVGALAVVIQILVALAVALAPADERGRAIGVVTSGVVAGLVAARTAAGVINDVLGWRAVFAIAGLLTGTLGVVLWRRLPPTPVAASRGYRRLVTGLTRLYRTHRVLRQRAVLALAIFGTLNVLWTPLAKELAGPPHRLSPTAIGLIGLVGIAGALTARRAGRLADGGHGRAASGGALVLMVGAWVPIALAGWSLPALVGGMVLIDVAVQTVHVVSQSLVTVVDPLARSSLVAAYMVCYSVGSAVGAAGSTALHAAHGWAGVAILGTATSAAGLAYWAASRPRDGADRPAATTRVAATPPSKRKPGYANFAIAEPPLKLVLFERVDADARLNHLGVEVASRDEVRAHQARLADQGLDSIDESGTCCYATQDKVWVDGPDGAWEIYTVLEDSDGFGTSSARSGGPGEDPLCCASVPEGRAGCC